MPVDDNCRSMADVIPFAILLLLSPKHMDFSRKEQILFEDDLPDMYKPLK